MVICFFPLLCYIESMTITQTVEIPAGRRRITLDVPPQLPAGKTIITFAPAGSAKKPAKEAPKKVPVFGSAKGKYRMAEDFDAPLEDFKDYM